MPKEIPVDLVGFSAEEMTWCRSRVTALRIMLPALDPMLRSLIQAMTVEMRSDPTLPDRITLPLEDVAIGDLALAEDLLGRLAEQAGLEAQDAPNALLRSIVLEVSGERSRREPA